VAEGQPASQADFREFDTCFSEAAVFHGFCRFDFDNLRIPVFPTNYVGAE
jgi:hypothetical protein